VAPNHTKQKRYDEMQQNRSNQSAVASAIMKQVERDAKMISVLVMIIASAVNMVERCKRKNHDRSGASAELAKTRKRFTFSKTDHGHCMQH
jgi:hypothetical protein